MAAAPAVELLPPPASGRRYSATRRVRLGDVDPRGRMRFDAIARHLQDVASDDAADSGLDGGWVVRRTLIAVTRPTDARRGPRPDDVLHRAPAVRGPSGARRSSAPAGRRSRPSACGSTSTRSAAGRRRSARRSTPATARPPASAGCRPGSPSPDRRRTPTPGRGRCAPSTSTCSTTSTTPAIGRPRGGHRRDEHRPRRRGRDRVPRAGRRRHPVELQAAVTAGGVAGLARGRRPRPHRRPGGGRQASGYGERMPLEGEYEPGTLSWSREQAELYESSGGTKGTTMRGMPVVLLTSRGAKTGKLRKTPLMRVEHDGRYAVVASLGGAPKHPVWYHNLVADPHVELQDGPVRQDMIAREVTGDEKARVVGARRRRLPRLRRLPGEDGAPDPRLRARADRRLTRHLGGDRPGIRDGSRPETDPAQMVERCQITKRSTGRRSVPTADVAATGERWRQPRRGVGACEAVQHGAAALDPLRRRRRARPGPGDRRRSGAAR